jgi:lambda repressor-like predicted transcriptional regulator
MIERASKRQSPGATLRALRKRNGWTLAEVSRRTGLPVPTLSKVENDRHFPSYRKLIQISEGLGVDMAALVAGPKDSATAEANRSTGRRSVARSGQGGREAPDGRVCIYPASDLLNKRMTPVISEVRAETLEAHGEMRHLADEAYVFVIEGEAELLSDLYAPLRLVPGDSVYFDAAMAHAFVRIGPAPCRILTVSPASDAEAA